MKSILQLVTTTVLILGTAALYAYLHANLEPQSVWAELFYLSWLIPAFIVCALWYYQQDLPTLFSIYNIRGLSALGFSINPVVGQSLSPQASSGNYVIFHRFFKRKNLRIGDLVKVDHPRLGIIVKHITYIDSNGLFWLRADNKMDISTLDMGPIRHQRIIGKTLFVIKSASHKQLLNF